VVDLDFEVEALAVDGVLGAAVHDEVLGVPLDRGEEEALSDARDKAAVPVAEVDVDRGRVERAVEQDLDVIEVLVLGLTVVEVEPHDSVGLTVLSDGGQQVDRGLEG